jgi:hypothetical protein
LAEFCYRTGGKTVYVCSKRPNGVTGSQYKGILAGSPKARGWGWATMRRNPGAYVKGRIRHADHATMTLHGWHWVLEHRGAVEGDEEHGVSGLTPAEKATTTARGGVEPLRASVIRGRRPNRRKRWLATW